MGRVDARFTFWDLMLTGFLFFVVFSFRIPVFYNSTVFALFLCIVFLAFFRKWSFSWDLVSRSGVLNVSLLYFFLFALVVLYAVLHGTGDLTRANSIFSNIGAVVTVFLFGIIWSGRVPRENTEDVVFLVSRGVYWCFLIQSMIIVAALFFPSAREVVQVFQDPAQTLRAESYEGVRGLALSGGQFFSLSAAYCLAQVFIAYYFVNKKNLGFLSALGFAVIAFAGVTAGRISIVGSVAFFCFMIVSSLVYKTAWKKLIKLVFYLIICAIVISEFADLLGKGRGIVSDYMDFAFEFVYEYLVYGQARTESTDILRRMYWLPPVSDVLFGYGYYSASDGKTFMSTDGGYMRNILFFGVVGLVYVVSSQIYIHYRMCGKAISNGRGLLFIATTVVVFILHYKGDTMMHLVSVQTLLITALMLGGLGRLKHG